MTGILSRVAAIVTALAAVVLTGAQAPLTAQAAVADRWGFAFMNNPTPPPGLVLDTNHQWGSWKTAFPGLWATVDQLAVGRYVVHFPQLASATLPIGIAHVTAVNPNPVWCQLLAWRSNPPNEDVFVQCYRVGGAPVNTQFTVLFTESTGLPVNPGDYGYVFATASGAIASQYNTSGAANALSVGPVGFWKVFLPNLGLPSISGDIQVTAQNAQQAVRCKVVDWAPMATGQVIEVGCIDAANAPVNSGWTLSYQRERPIIGVLGPPKLFAYTFPTLGPLPPTPYNFNSVGAPNNISSAGVGLHLVEFQGVGQLQDHVQVTAFGPSPDFCGLNTIWGTFGGNAVVRDVACFDGAGAPIDTRAFTTYTSRF